MIKLSKESDYGLLFISYLKKNNDYISLAEIVDKLKLPSKFLARIASKLAKHKIVISREGKKGGYKLAKKAYNINFYDYLNIFERNLLFLKCQEKDYSCNWQKYCDHRFFFKNNFHKAFVNNLKKIKLKDIF